MLAPKLAGGGKPTRLTSKLSCVFVVGILLGSCGESEPTNSSSTSAALTGSAAPAPAPEEILINTEPVVPPDFVGSILESVKLTDAERAALEKASQLHRARNPRGDDRTRRGFGRRDGQDVRPGGGTR
ncbi:MAG: hypothetical protein KBG15_13075 [Kofleriaceae bacterium]|nr:hypothetical protein [Kofleriaceae bacterium]